MWAIFVRFDQQDFGNCLNVGNEEEVGIKDNFARSGLMSQVDGGTMNWEREY